MIHQYKAEETEAGLDIDIKLFHEKSIYCFIGENGVGKTHLLENLARSLVYSHAAFRKRNDKFTIFKKEPIHRFPDEDTRLRVIRQLEHAKLQLPWEISINNIKIKERHKDDWNIIELGAFAGKTCPFQFNHPLIFIGKDKRGRVDPIAIRRIDIHDDNADRFSEFFMDHLKTMHGNPPDENPAMWFARRLLINSKFMASDRYHLSEVVTVLELLRAFEPEMDDCLIEENGEIRPNILFDEGKIWLGHIPIDKLPTGYIALLQIFRKIIDGFNAWNYFTETPDRNHRQGVVLIDDIELYFHPNWLQRIIPFLRDRFPKIVFYLTTRSPQVISTLQEGEAYTLSLREDVISAKNITKPADWYLADVFLKNFRIDVQPSVPSLQPQKAADMNQLMARFSDLVKDYSASKSAELKLEIEALYYEITSKLPKDSTKRQYLEYLKKLVK